MPISPKPVVPRSRPASTDDARVKPRDTTAPTSAQNAPTARRIVTESLGPADRTSSLLVTAVACSLSIEVGARTGSAQEALDLLAHAVELFWRHVRVQGQSQGLTARRHRLLHPLAHPMCHPSQEGLLVDRRIEVALGLDPARRQTCVDRVTAGPGPCGNEQHEVV